MSKKKKEVKKEVKEKLRTFEYVNEGVEDVSKVKIPKDVQFIDFWDNEISSFEGFAEFPDLEKINLTANRVVVIKGIENIPKLKTLILEENQVEMITDASYDHVMNNGIEIVLTPDDRPSRKRGIKVIKG